MEIRDLQVINFRNLQSVKVEFSPGLNLVYGANAQGKTNLLEAIYLLVTGRSFRTAPDREMIPWVRESYDATVIRATVDKRLGEERCILTFNQAEKHILVNGEAVARLGDLIGRINAVLFTPSDLQLVQGTPGTRRRFLDIALSQVSRAYLRNLQCYDLALRQRNALLKQHQHRPDLRQELQVWDAQLIEHGTQLTVSRSQMLEALSRDCSQAYQVISGNSESLQLVYRPSPSATDNSYTTEVVTARMRNALAASCDDDIRRGSTSHGPHRDDFDFLLNAHNARDYGSQGQQRSCVLALKLAEVKYMQSITGELPLLLLDDLISELDDRRQSALLAFIPPNIQTFITATSLEQVRRHITPQRAYMVQDGKLGL